MVVVDRERCIGCKICEQLCPANVFRVIDGKVDISESNLENCVNCRNCEISCPTGCISASKEVAANQA
ncbi:MAG: 4Fe-4S binding protein [Candidatus Altiarchaeota archaeon]|nr:4Fe-4S binding protein [Candidatus Altiarchaeota archaeon]